VWFQNRRAKFRRNERSILAQRSQLQQFAAAAAAASSCVGRSKCAVAPPSAGGASPAASQLHTDDAGLYQRPQPSQRQVELLTPSKRNIKRKVLSEPRPFFCENSLRNIRGL